MSPEQTSLLAAPGTACLPVPETPVAASEAPKPPRVVERARESLARYKKYQHGDALDPKLNAGESCALNLGHLLGYVEELQAEIAEAKSASSGLHAAAVIARGELLTAAARLPKS